MSAFAPAPLPERGPSSAQLFPRPKDGRSPGGAALRGRAGPCSADPCQRRPDARRRPHARSAALQVSPHRCQTPCKAAAPVQGQCREPRGLRRRPSGSIASLSFARPPRSVSPATARVADIVMAVPKKRQSKMKTRQRKANVRAPADAAVPFPRAACLAAAASCEPVPEGTLRCSQLQLMALSALRLAVVCQGEEAGAAGVQPGGEREI